MNNHIAFIFCLMICCVSFSQTKLSGNLYSEDSTSISDANILILEYYSDKYITSTKTDDRGFFQFSKALDIGVYNIEVSRLGFSKLKQTLVIEKDSKAALMLDLFMTTSELSKLDEVIVQSKPPVIVKKDTIIYDVEHHTEAYDENLEQVLSRLEGFEIQANGDIKVNGKIINKILIDGKEVSDLGNAMLTKSLSPEDVKNIEVRFDEKNRKLKESLLSDEKFAVLDVQLQSDLNKSFFGKQQASTGYQSNTKLGAYGNFFSLNENFNLQLFGESTNFGNNRIDLKQIKNIGEEAVQNMLSLPKDFNEVKERQGLQKELYGFNNFTQNDNSILGLSTNFVLSEQTDLYFGTFNKYAFTKNASQTTQFFQNILQNQLQIDNTNRELHTKNKLQLKHTGKHIKIKTDVNYVWFDNAIQTQAESGFNRDFNRENRTRNLYLNNAIEYEFSSKIGAVAKTSYKSEDYRIQSFFETDDSDIAAFIGRSIDESVYELNQINDHKETQFVQDIRLNLKSSWGNHFFGYRWRYNQLENSKNTNFSNQFDFEFNNPNQSLDYRLHNGIYSYQNAFGELSVNTDLTLSEMEFPFGETREKDYFFQYSLALNYDFSETASLDFMGSKSLGNFPLEKIIGGSYFQNFQTIFLPSQFLEPFFNTTYTLSYFKNFRSRNFEIDAAVLHGISENLNNQTFSNKLILQTADQLQSSYTAYSVKFKKTLGQTKLILEPEMLNNSF